MGDDDETCAEMMKADMEAALRQLGCNDQLASNLATMFAGLGMRDVQIGTVAEWLAVAYLLDGVTPPPGRCTTIIAQMRITARDQVLKYLGVNLERERVLVPVQLAVAGRWEEFERKVIENVARREAEEKPDASSTN